MQLMRKHGGVPRGLQCVSLERGQSVTWESQWISWEISSGMKKINLSTFYGTVELKMFSLFEGGRVVTYGYSIHKDRNGNETHRTKPVPLSSLGWEDGSSFTENDYKVLHR